MVIQRGVLVMVALLSAASAAALETPKYEVVTRFGDVEIRRYESVNVAQTLVPGRFRDVANEGFRRLAGYIFGGNQVGQKIAMTAPVSQRIDESGDSYWLTFMLPSEHKLTDLPKPSDDRVEITAVPDQMMAVIGYRGSWNESRYRKHESRLLESLKASPEWQSSGPAIWSRFDPPITPWFLRRNEISIPVVRKGGDA